MVRFPIVLFLFVFYFGWSQQESPLENLSIDSFKYPDFGDGSQYGNFELRYPITEGTTLGLYGINQQNYAFRRFNSRIFLNHELTKGLRAVIGYEMEWDLTRPDWKQDNSKSMFLGVEYEPKPNLLINMGIRNFFNEPDFNPLGTMNKKTNAQFTFGSRLKF